MSATGQIYPFEAVTHFLSDLKRGEWRQIIVTHVEELAYKLHFRYSLLPSFVQLIVGCRSLVLQRNLAEDMIPSFGALALQLAVQIEP